MRVAATATLAGLTLLALTTGPASGQEVPPPKCQLLHTDPGRYQPSPQLEKAVQRLMRPRLDGTQRSPKQISEALQRQGYDIGYTRHAADVKGGTTAVIADGARLTTVVLVYGQILNSGFGTCTNADGSTYQVTGTISTFAERYPVQALARIPLVPQSCLRTSAPRRATLAPAYLRAARRLLAPTADGHLRTPTLIAALLTRNGYPTLPVRSVREIRGVSLRLDKSGPSRLVVAYRQLTCAPDQQHAYLLVLTTTIRPIRRR